MVSQGKVPYGRDESTRRGGTVTHHDSRALRVEMGALAVLDVISVGAGMGVPVFAILLGFVVGWRLARRHGLRRALTRSALLSGLTLAMMIAIWAPKFALLAQPGFDASEWGIPLVLYTSTASFFGWQALMIAGGPVLQFMAAATSAALTEARRS